eukprot:1159744-Pelagomonas_calceolata.AAC.5
MSVLLLCSQTILTCAPASTAYVTTPAGTAAKRPCPFDLGPHAKMPHVGHPVRVQHCTSGLPGTAGAASCSFPASAIQEKHWLGNTLQKAQPGVFGHKLEQFQPSKQIES